MFYLTIFSSISETDNFVMSTQHHTQITENIEKMQQVSGFFWIERHVQSHGMKHSEIMFEKIKSKSILAPYDYINRFTVREWTRLPTALFNVGKTNVLDIPPLIQRVSKKIPMEPLLGIFSMINCET